MTSYAHKVQGWTNGWTRVFQYTHHSASWGIINQSNQITEKTNQSNQITEKTNQSNQITEKTNQSNQITKKTNKKKQITVKSLLTDIYNEKTNFLETT